MKLYRGIDLHSTNNYVALLDGERQTVLSRKLPNRLEAVLGCLQPYRQDLVAIAVESTFNWYWLVDGVMDDDYRVELVNTLGRPQVRGPQVPTGKGATQQKELKGPGTRNRPRHSSPSCWLAPIRIALYPLGGLAYLGMEHLLYAEPHAWREGGCLQRTGLVQ